MVKLIASHMVVTTPMLIDGRRLGAFVEYRLFAKSRPMTLRERLTGWRSFTSREGITITMRVGWRSRLYWWTHPIQNWRRHHPPVYEDDDL